MRSAFAVLAAAIFTATPSQHADSLLDRPLTVPVSVTTPVQDRDIATLAAAIGRAAGVPLGFEEVPETRSIARPEGRRKVTLEASTAGEALAELTRLDPRYDVHEMNRVIVVRPKVAWTEPHNPLNQPVVDVTLDSVSLETAVARVLEMLYGPSYGGGGRAAQAAGAEPLSIRVASGSVLDVLDEIARVHGGLTWMVMYRGINEPEPKAKFALWIRTHGGQPPGFGHVYPTLPLSMRPPSD